MADLLRRMAEGKEEYSFPTPDGRPIAVHGDTEREAYEKFKEYMGWD